jgi:pimeloyl-ACP methyl ester carboxylesterase
MANSDDKSIDWQHAGRVGLSAINGIFGDYLHRQGNPLATQMGFYVHRERVELSNQALTEYPYPISSKLVVMLHGLTNLETIWNISQEADPVEDNFATRLHYRSGYTPFYIRYNSGLEIKENGLSFSQAMTDLVAAYPQPIDEIVLIGFSMGGLIIRHALHDASIEHKSWVKKVTQTFYIGSPHEGAPLEKFGTLTSSVLRQIPRDYISHWADWVDLRSRGIKDLRHGLLADEFSRTQSYARNHALSDDDCVHVPESVEAAYGFPPQIKHHFISGSVGKEHQEVMNFLVGDSLVRTPSALPEGAPAGSPVAHFFGIPHLKLASAEPVYQQIDAWLEEESTGPARSYAPVLKPKNKTAGRVKAEHIVGTMQALTAGFDELLKSVRLVHMSIADEPLSILEKIPVTKHTSKAVKEVHHGIANVIYDSLKVGSQALRASSQVVADVLAPETTNKKNDVDPKA